MAKRKVNKRKQLLKEPDEVLVFSRRVFNYAMNNLQIVFGGLGGVILIALIVLGVRAWGNSNENSGAFKLTEAKTSFYKALENNPQDIESAFSAASEQFEAVLDDYCNTVAGKMGAIVYANICYETGRFNKAISLYEKALKHFYESSSLYPVLRYNLAYSYASNENYDKAIALLEKDAFSPDGVMKDDMLFLLGLVYDRKGNVEKRDEIYKMIQSGDETAMFYNIVKHQLSKS